MLKLRIILLILFFLILSIPNSFSIKLQDFEAEYNFNFSGFKAGKGTLHVFYDNSTYYIKFTGKTVPPLSWFYSLKVSIEDAINIKNFQDVYYKSTFKRPKKVKTFYIVFDNKTMVKVIYKKNLTTRIYILKSTKDIDSPLKTYLFFLHQKVKLGEKYFRDVVVSKKLYRVEIIPLETETINIDAFKRNKGKIRTLKTQIYFFRLTKEGKIKKDKKIKNFTVWISLTPPKIPVLIRMEYTIGFFEARLTKIKIFKIKKVDSSTNLPIIIKKSLGEEK